MDLREHFAGLAMAAMCAKGGDPDYVAKLSVRFADALIAELAKEPV